MSVALLYNRRLLLGKALSAIFFSLHRGFGYDVGQILLQVSQRGQTAGHDSL